VRNVENFNYICRMIRFGYIVKMALTVAFLGVASMICGQEEAEEDGGGKVTIDVGADLVSSYVWRGMYQTGASIQPSLSLSAFGFTLGSWASNDFTALVKEVDFYLSYEVKGVTIGLFDFWCEPEGTSYFCYKKHLLEANLHYTISEKFPLSLEVNTMIAGDDDTDDKGKRLYSTYMAASWPFSVKDVDCEASIGVSPWRGLYGEKCNVAAITARASRNLNFSSGYSVPLFVELIFSPVQRNAFLVFGLTF